MSEEKSFVSALAFAGGRNTSCDQTAWVNCAGMGIRLHSACASDDELMYRIFASTRAAEMAITGWSAGQQEAFLRMQFEAQRRSYLMQMPDAEYFVVRRGEVGVGRLILNRLPRELHIADIAVLPEFHRMGIGSALMRDIFEEAEQTGKKVSLQVEQFNPALRWYRRLGYNVVNTGPIYFEMVRECPESRAVRAASGLENDSCQSI